MRGNANTLFVFLVVLNSLLYFCKIIFLISKCNFSSTILEDTLLQINNFDNDNFMELKCFI